MLTRADRQLLTVIGVLLLASIVLSIVDGGDPGETVWVPGGLNVLAYTSTPFLEDELPAYINEYTAVTGTEINVILTPDINSALIRAAVDNTPVDVIMVPFDMREEFRRAGRITPLHEVLTSFSNPNIETAMRWLWSSIDNQPICGFLLGETGGPTFACIWYQTQYADQAAKFIEHLVVNTSTSESRLGEVIHFARKLLVEEDYGAVYDYLLHPSRLDVVSRDEFVTRSQLTWCSDGVIQDVQVRNLTAELNTGPKIDPRTGKRYETSDLLQYSIEYYCVRDGYRDRGATHVIRTLRYPYPAVFIPFETFITWPSPSAYEGP